MEPSNFQKDRILRKDPNKEDEEAKNVLTGTVIASCFIEMSVINGISVISGTGSPEGVVAAPMGSIYTSKTGGVGTTLYIKQSGSGKVGWGAK